MRFSWILLVAFPAVPAGCESGKYAPVSGIVRLDDKPLSDAVIIFRPVVDDTQMTAPSSIGATDNSGKFTLKVPTAKSDGAVLGKHTVSISKINEVGKEVVPERYNANTTLTFEVVRGGTSSANFDLKSP